MLQKRRFDVGFVKELVHSIDLPTLMIRHNVDLVKKGKTFKARCPFHDDSTPSFVIGEGSPYYHCFGCGAKGNALSFLITYANLDYVKAVQELSGFVGREPVYEGGDGLGNVVTRTSNTVFTKPTRPKTVKLLEPYAPVLPKEAHRFIPKSHFELGEPIKVWWYTDSYLVYLFPYQYDAQGNKKKEFRPVHWQPFKQRWVFGDPSDCLLPLYKINELTEGQKIIFCEGEKAADAASYYFKTGLCTTTAHGSKSPSRSDFEPVAGHEVLIFPDNDLPGWLYACEVAGLCKRALAREVKIVYWDCSQVPAKWDLADPLEAGWSKERLVNSVKVFNYE